MNSPEKFIPTQEKGEQLAQAAEKQSEALRSRLEKLGEDQAENRREAAQEALLDATTEAKSGTHEDATEASFSKETAAVRRITRAEKETAYKETLRKVRSEMRPTEKAFSKVIHNPFVEKTSEIAGKTLFRPNAILAAGISAFILSGITYILARHFGYPLSGFETIAALLLGFMLGILYDFLKVMLTGRKAE
ncbi:MAG TPA: hypothetical protein VFZ48_01685 [Candidatus Saccharimonadales bacterium]